MIQEKDLNSTLDAFILAGDIDVFIVTPEDFSSYAEQGLKGDRLANNVAASVLNTLKKSDETESYPCLTCKTLNATTNDDGNFGVMAIFGTGTTHCISGLLCSDCLGSDDRINRFCASLLGMMKKRASRMAPAGEA